MTEADPASPEGQVLRHLMTNGVGPVDRTVSATTQATSLTSDEVEHALRNLEKLDPPLLRHEVDANLRERVWFPTFAALGDHD